jgi:adsorption protein B
MLGLAPPPPSPLPGWAMWTNIGLLGWRMAWRAGFTWRSCGWRLALLAPAHMLIGNLVAMAAAVRAIGLYVGIVRSGRVRWDKTTHVFPAA